MVGFFLVIDDVGGGCEVEFPVSPGHGESVTGGSGGMHCGSEARRADATFGTVSRFSYQRGNVPFRCIMCCN